MDRVSYINSRKRKRRSFSLEFFSDIFLPPCSLNININYLFEKTLS